MKLKHTLTYSAMVLGGAALLGGCTQPSEGVPDASNTAESTAPAGCRTVCDCAEHGPSDDTGEASAADAGAVAVAPSTDPQEVALERANHWRTSAGLASVALNPQIQQAADAHAAFMATTDRATCWSTVHDEVEAGCSGFTGATSSDRVTTTGYAWGRVSEVINWEAEPADAVDAWVWSAYHRQPFFDWRLRDAGFARTPGTLGNRRAYFNVMVLASPRTPNASDAPPTAPVVFPVPGQTDVPPSFRGDLESPTLPAPGGGRDPWPSGVTSGTVVSVHFPSPTFQVTAHRIFRAGRAVCEELASTFASRETDPNLRRGPPASDVFLYADAPLEPGTEYVVQFEGTVGQRPWARTWSFTTR